MNLSSTQSGETAIHTSFIQLFGKTVNGLKIHEIEIPLIQRDYAQGRKTERVKHVRERFITDLCGALHPGKYIDLDFVFGDVDEKGTFFPLDGQQRLTTLFLLHCYLAWRVEEGAPKQNQSWHAFSYATRPSARAFCKFLVKCQPDMSSELSQWLKDQADYLPTWKHDPTIQSMLVVLDTLHEHFSNKQPSDFQSAWERLTDTYNPAIQFHLLPMEALGLTNKLYIKMNSRGKPLTDFENFKANFEELLNKSHPGNKAGEFSSKVDTDWADILWPYRGDNHLIDEEFMRYFRFLTEVRAWKNNIDFNSSDRVDDLAEKVYGATAPQAEESVDWLVQGFDVWKDKAIKIEFGKLFTRKDQGTTTLLRMFNFKGFDEETIGVDLFGACCRHYGSRWSFAHTLLLYGVIIGSIEKIEDADFAKRLRLLRNLIEASSDEIRAGERNNMPKLLGDVEQIILHADLDSIRTFNQVQVANETAKMTLLQAHPALQADMWTLEDHELLRGGLTVFDLNPALFQQRAAQFSTLFTSPFTEVTGGLLAKGNYAREQKRTSNYRFLSLGSPKHLESWENLFRGRRGENPHPSCKTLMDLLDEMASGKSLAEIKNIYLNAPDTEKDWQYYLVKYEAMRSGESGCYVIAPIQGYQMCMLRGDSCDDRSYHYDPYLMALAEISQMSADRIGNTGWPRGFPGYETNERHLVLRQSGLKIQSVEEGWKLDVTTLDSAQRMDFNEVARQCGIQNELYSVPQRNGIDMVDRIDLGAKLLNALLNVGL